MDTTVEVQEDTKNNVDSTIAFRVALGKLNELQEQHILALASLHQVRQELKNQSDLFQKQQEELAEPNQQLRNENEDLRTQLRDMKEEFLAAQQEYTDALTEMRAGDDKSDDGTTEDQSTDQPQDSQP